MSDPVGYITLNVIGPDAREALSWLHREVEWERRQRQLAAAHADDRDAVGPRAEPSTAA